MKKILLLNNVNYHYEVIESLIVKYREILNVNLKDEDARIYISNIERNKSYVNYIKDKYPNVILKLINDYDYIIHVTIYDKDFNYLDKSINSKERYISHEITDRLLTNPNVYYLTPISNKNIFIANILPFTEKKIKTDIPIYIIQGNLNHGRRHLNSLKKILSKDYQYKYTIKLIGNGSFPKELNDYKSKILCKANLNFQDYHNEFTSCYCILPLITKESHPNYYTKKLTSTVNYANGYNIKCLIDKDLQNIYNLKNAEVYNNQLDICDVFEKTLKDFYKIE